jgi:uncharacterized DUF497 family protein
MGSFRITELDIDDRNLVHLSQHGVSPEEIYQCLWNRKKVRAKKEERGRYYLYGSTDGGKLLFVVLVDLGGGLARPISAREMTPAERRYYVKK